MVRMLIRTTGWVLIVGAVICGLLTIPVWNGRGSVTGGSMQVDSGLFKTTVIGDGQFTHEAYWSVSWHATVLCGLILASGLLLVWKRAAPAVRGGEGIANAHHC